MYIMPMGIAGGLAVLWRRIEGIVTARSPAAAMTRTS